MIKKLLICILIIPMIIILQGPVAVKSLNKEKENPYWRIIVIILWLIVIGTIIYEGR